MGTSGRDRGIGVSFGWRQAGPLYAHMYLLPVVFEELPRAGEGPLRIVDLGCGNGHVTAQIAGLGHEVVGVDSSADGIEIARATHPGVQFECESPYSEHIEDVAGTGADVAVALEVIEHLFTPRRIGEVAWRLLRPGGCLVFSTPYHGYLKNLALSLTNGWDRHFHVWHDGGHIIFFSRKTLLLITESCGLRPARFYGVARFVRLWKPTVMSAEKA